MRKISKALLKTYYWLIGFFGFFSLLLLFIFCFYLWKESSENIKTVETFFNYEMKELEEKAELRTMSVASFFKVALEESPKIPDVYVEINYKGKLYREAPFLNTKERNKIDYFEKVNVYEVTGYDPIEVTIIRRMTKHRILVTYTITIAFLCLLVSLTIVMKIWKNFYQKFIVSLDSLTNITQNFNLNSEETLPETNTYFVEFYLLENSFKQMIHRIQEQSRKQGDFINNASHELKTPIFILKGYIDMLQRWGKKDEKLLEESLDTMKEEVRNMQDLTEKLLFLAKEHNNLLEKKCFSVDGTLEGVIRNFQFLFPKQEMEVVIEKIEMESDEELLKLLFKNIIENAIKYGKGNPIKISLRKEKTIEFRVQDFGMGISKEALPNIFDRFYREDASRNRESKSYGLGLSIVKTIIQKLKADIKIESELGKGTTVSVYLK